MSNKNEFDDELENNEESGDNKPEKDKGNKKNEKKDENSKFDFDKFISNGNNFNFKNIVLLIFLITVIISIPSLLGRTNLSGERIITYSQFIDEIESGRITEIEEKTPFMSAQIRTGAAEVTVLKARMIANRIAHDPNLMEIVKENNVKIQSMEPDKTPVLLSILISWFPMLLLIGIWVYMLSQMNKGPGGGPGQIFSMGKTKKQDDKKKVNVRFDDVAGVDEAKEELQEVVEFLKEPDKFLAIGAKIPKGVLLLGAPGTGKTLLAKAVAGEAGVPFFNISGSEFVEMFVGVGASRVRDLFSKAKKDSPAIVFIDEIDAVARQRGAGLGGGNDEREQTLNQLLVEMDGFGTDENIIVIAATNRPDVLDPAIMRPGRFDRQVVVDKPDIKAREQILKVHIKKKKLADDVELSVIARKTPGFAGADLENVMNEAAILAARHDRKKVFMDDLEEAVEKVMAGPERKSRVMNENEKKIIAYHEAGHALIRWLLPDTDPVHKISIVPRGVGALGYTMHLPTEDRFLVSKQEFFKEIKTLLGGRAAEELIFKDITSGASNDIERATDIARKMITKYGMSEKVGPLTLGKNEEHPFLGKDIVKEVNYSNETARIIDDEISGIILNIYDEVKKMLTKHMSKLEKLTSELLVRETLSGKEMEGLFKEIDSEQNNSSEESNEQTTVEKDNSSSTDDESGKEENNQED